MKSDVKATQKTGDGLVFAGRTRLRGIVLGAPNTTTVAAGALVTTTGLTGDAIVTGNVGASAATGGTYTGILTYYCVDDGKDS